MERTNSYKKTEVGVIPEDWEVRKLGEVFNIMAGGDLKEDSYSATKDDEHRFPIYSNGIFLKGLYGFSSSYDYPGNAVTVTARGTIGNANYRDHKFSAIGRVLVLQPKYKVNGFFVSEYINSRISFSVESTGVPQLTAPKMSLYKIPLPPLPEQKAIAKVLSDVDELITSIEELIDKKQKIKQGTMQLLLTGKKRLPGFTGEWEVKKLGEVFEFLPTSSKPRSDLIDEGNIKYIHYGDIHTKWNSILDCSNAQIPYIDEKKVKSLPLLKEGDLVMADASEDYAGLGKSIEIKNIGKQKIVAGLHTILLRGNKELVADGFKGYIQFIKSVKDSLCSIATGISVYGISKKNLKNIQIPLPPLQEQKAIAQILSDMDLEIEALEAKLEKYKHIKEGMMEQLLTGKVRLI